MKKRKKILLLIGFFILFLINALQAEKEPQYALYYQIGTAVSYLDASDDAVETFSTETINGLFVGAGFEHFFIAKSGFELSGRVAMYYIQKGYAVQGFSEYQSILFHYGIGEALLAVGYRQIISLGFGWFYGHMFGLKSENVTLSNDALYNMFEHRDTGYLVKFHLGVPFSESVIFAEYTYHRSTAVNYRTLNGEYKNKSHLISIGYKKKYYTQN